MRKPKQKKQSLIAKNLHSTPPTPPWTLLPLLYLVVASMASVATGAPPRMHRPPPPPPNISAMFVLGDSSVDCGDNTLFYSILHNDLSLRPCNGSDSTLLPRLLAEKMQLPIAPPFYNQNGSIEGVMSGLNYGSAQATILNPSNKHSHQSLNQQLRQVSETSQLLQLQLGEERTNNLFESSIFYLSFGKDDYIDLFLRNTSGVLQKYSGLEFAHILVNQMSHAIKALYDMKVGKIVVVGIVPLGCTPRIVFQWHNSAARHGRASGCVEEINRLVVQYNVVMEGHIVNLMTELPGAQIIFCDVYQGIMEILAKSKTYGFEDVSNACCGLGRYGAMIGCLSVEMACDQSSSYLWWDLYNPTQAVNSLLADSAWSGHSLDPICRPISVQKLASTPPPHFA